MLPSQDPVQFEATVAALAAAEEAELLLHPGRGNGPRLDQRVLTRHNFLATFDQHPAACRASLRHTADEVEVLTNEVRLFINRPRPAAAGSHAADDFAAAILAGQQPPERRFRHPVTSDANRVASVLEHLVNPQLALETLGAHLGVSKATVSKQLRWDIVNMIEALRDELPALMHANIIRQVLEPMGPFADARVIVDSTDTRIQDLLTNFNVHHQFASLKTLLFVAEDGTILCVEVGYGGADADIRLLRESPWFTQLQQQLAAGERLLMGDGAFLHPHAYIPVNAVQLAAHPIQRAELLVYNSALQYYRARVEHAIGRAKHHWGAIAAVPGIKHMCVDDIINMILLSFLLEARLHRLAAAAAI